VRVAIYEGIPVAANNFKKSKGEPDSYPVPLFLHKAVIRFEVLRYVEHNLCFFFKEPFEGNERKA